MKITDFKKGDLIHRIKPRIIEQGSSFSLFSYSRPSQDRSFMDDPIEFIAVKSNLLFYEYVNEPMLKGIHQVSIDNMMEDWDYFPTEFLESDDLKN